jgi:hypothetical protein
MISSGVGSVRPIGSYAARRAMQVITGARTIANVVTTTTLGNIGGRFRATRRLSGHRRSSSKLVLKI